MDAENFNLVNIEWAAKVRMEYKDKKCHHVRCGRCSQISPEPEYPCVNHCNCIKEVWLVKKGYSLKTHNDAWLAKLASASKTNK